jgi:F-type H+-transporting ATPase subunit b
MDMSLAALVLAQEESGSGGISLVLPEVSELVAGIIAFAIVFFFFWRWALPTLNRTLEQRQAAITGKLAEAEKAKAEAESLLADYRGQLAESRGEGNRIVEEARQSAEQMRGEIVSKAETEAEQIRARAREEAANEKSRALTEARREVGDISVDLAGRIVGESLDEKAHKALIDRYLADLEKL